MASGLFALLDDIAAIAKLAAASLDDVAAASARATGKAAGVVIDDTAVTPRYVMGFRPERELPLVWRIAKGSLRNKLLVLMPGFLLLATLLPRALTPLLMAGGAFLCFEAAEKLIERSVSTAGDAAASGLAAQSEADERRMVAGAIRTDLVLSDEILAIALGELGRHSLAMKAAALAVVSLAVTAGVYGLVALIVKMDDVGVRLAAGSGRFARRLGRMLVAGMPRVLAGLSALGVAAMAWVGGGIVLHGLQTAGPLAVLPHAVHAWAQAAAVGSPAVAGVVAWLVEAALAGLFGLALGGLLAVWVHLWHRARAPAS
ncbi:MAG: DUF808 domain-containing protein [Sphingomonadaceae bacterium]|uniref:DUF808 domain-containing protein n=1 Tax=Thermaurantiacus sp. TaxID=2820283 RepID=UPI00298F1D88|nr:DUF808 domain-containing protein [Thermaurantiacus sp.]MCS6986601.1 DUF808 domain-containing protein [Sphingomonadaceae bacterium]MDW8414138.1 DUF808 domain-containing protein [Thermaurantiacus sp.]